MKYISIIGAGSHTRSSINLLKYYFSDYDYGIYDNSFDNKNEEFIHNIKLQGNLENIPQTSKLFLSIGDNENRKIFFNEFYEKLIKKNLFHQTSYVENNSSFGVSNQVFANVYINSFVIIGDDNIINTSAILDHEVKIGNHNHISVGAKVCGRVHIGNNCFIGAGSIIIDKVSICDDVILGAGSVVIRDINETGTYVGNPARKIK